MAAGLSGRVTVLLEDYRDLVGRYDKLVSIEMIKAAGTSVLRHLFQAVRAAAEERRPAAAAGDHHCRSALRAGARSVDFIQRHIFPGRERAAR